MTGKLNAGSGKNLAHQNPRSYARMSEATTSDEESSTRQRRKQEKRKCWRRLANAVTQISTAITIVGVVVTILGNGTVNKAQK
jgi:uncharacterized membrane protein